jgi:hypothetical protein
MAARIAEVLGWLSPVPMSARRFRVRAADVPTLYRIDRTVLAAATDAGLPRVGEGDDALYDSEDLMNLALYLPLKTFQRGAMRFWARLLDLPAEEQRTYQISYRATCPTPGHPGRCAITFLGTNGKRVQTAGSRPAEHAFTAVLRSDWPDLPPPLAELAVEMAGVRFVRLPNAIRWNTDFCLANGIADCAGAALLLAERGAKRGWESRVRLGLIVAPPYSMPHFWAEFRVDGRWLPCDPGLVTAMVGWGVLAPGRWPPERPPGALLAGVTSTYTGLVLHNGFVVSASFPTQLVASTESPSR